MITKTKLAAALFAALGIAASGAFAATDASRASWTSWQDRDTANAVGQLAKKGRGGRDDVIEHPTCDDHGNDLACALASKGRGKDGKKPEDNGVDAPDACDDHGDDRACA